MKPIRVMGKTQDLIDETRVSVDQLAERFDHSIRVVTVVAVLLAITSLVTVAIVLGDRD